MQTLLASVLVVGLSAGAAGAEETYLIKLYRSKEGTKSRVEKNERGKVDTVINGDGVKKEEAVTSDTKEIYTEEVLAIDATTKQITKLSRKYTVAEKTEKGETTKAVYAGKTVLIEKIDGAFTFSVDGKPLSEDAAPDLIKSYKDKKADEPTNEDLVPTEAVAVGRTWKVPVDKADKTLKLLGDGKIKFDASKSTIEGKLVKVYKKVGAQFGVMEFTITAVVTEIGSGDESVATTTDSKMVMKITIDTCIDGTVEFEDATADASVDIVAEFPQAGSVSVRGAVTFTSKINALKK
ncbi:unnamed protein product [Gemmata massiliana]|uniref:Uncharacterized protein n=1 Tax=Gemmata massiliana TaxID=1210884 RepID=A0A6P2D5Y1_9BACT|nr:hypothetical protein [Gemmata massiliana]VTR95855.1 unnamed protein product [Gemmata massiliana]